MQSHFDEGLPLPYHSFLIFSLLFLITHTQKQMKIVIWTLCDMIWEVESTDLFCFCSEHFEAILSSHIVSRSVAVVVFVVINTLFSLQRIVFICCYHKCSALLDDFFALLHSNYAGWVNTCCSRTAMHFQVLNGITFETVISLCVKCICIIADEIQMISIFVCSRYVRMA